MSLFYSQILTKQQIDNLCARCEVRFDQWSMYHRHVIANTCRKQIKPFNTSGRTKHQIVTEWELQNKGAIL